MVSESRLLMTWECYSNLESELAVLRGVDRINALQAVADAKAWGDLSENFEYHAARDHQMVIERRIVEIVRKLARAEIVDETKVLKDSVRFGATVTLLNKETNEVSTYKIVGTDEANINKGMLSILSPLSCSLLGKSSGETVEVVAPSGIKIFKIIDLVYK